MILHLARREWLEQRRHPLMIGICAALLVVLAALTLGTLGLLQLMERTPETTATLAAFLGGEEAATTFQRGAVQGTLAAWNFLIVSQYLGFVGVMAGHSLLHDRQVGTLPFLLLAPIRRQQLLAGKVLGALGPLTLVHWTICLLGGALTLLLPVTASYPEFGPRSAAWWVAILLAGPVWAAFVATAAAMVSSVARDVRLAQQGVWFVVFFVQLLVAFLITGSLGSLGAQVGAVALGAVAGAVALTVGTGILQRDLGR